MSFFLAEQGKFVPPLFLKFKARYNKSIFGDGMATIKDIAQEAGVSTVTVSNVIRGAKSHVSQETYEKITKLIEKHHYTPNMMARTLVTKNSHLIGFINHSESLQEGEIQDDPFFGLLLRSIERDLSLKNYYLMTKTVTNEQEFQSICDNWNLAGLIVYGVFEGSFFNKLSRSKIPCVFIDSYIAGNSCYNVGLEDYKGAYRATEYLISSGHKNIAFVSPVIFDTGVVHERFMGYRDALRDNGIEFKQENVYQVSTLSSGIPLGEKLAERNDLTAAFATADLLALGIMAGLQRKGKKVPEDISVMGFDDIFESRLFVPSLTTVRQDVRQKAASTVNNLLDLIDGKEVIKNTILPIQIIERDSVKKIR